MKVSLFTFASRENELIAAIIIDLGQGRSRVPRPCRRAVTVGGQRARSPMLMSQQSFELSADRFPPANTKGRASKLCRAHANFLSVPSIAGSRRQ
jgi:hypothetical protein